MKSKTRVERCLCCCCYNHSPNIRENECLNVCMCVSRTFFSCLLAHSAVRTHFSLHVNNILFVTSSHVIRSHCGRLSRLLPLVSHIRRDFIDVCMIACMWMCSFPLLIYIFVIFFFSFCEYTYTEITRTTYNNITNIANFPVIVVVVVVVVYKSILDMLLTYHLIDLH